MKNSLESLLKILDMRIKMFCELKDKSAEIIQTKAHRGKKDAKTRQNKASKNCGAMLNGLIYLEFQNERKEKMVGKNI